MTVNALLTTKVMSGLSRNIKVLSKSKAYQKTFPTFTNTVPLTPATSDIVNERWQNVYIDMHNDQTSWESAKV